MNDFKLYVLNTFSFLLSFTEIDEVLKIILLAVSIGYKRWYYLIKIKMTKIDENTQFKINIKTIIGFGILSIAGVYFTLIALVLSVKQK